MITFAPFNANVGWGGPIPLTSAHPKQQTTPQVGAAEKPEATSETKNNSKENAHADANEPR